MTRHLPDALMILGGVLVPVGVACYHVPAALIVSGVELLAVGLLLTLGGRHGTTR